MLVPVSEMNLDGVHPGLHVLPEVDVLVVEDVAVGDVACISCGESTPGCRLLHAQPRSASAHRTKHYLVFTIQCDAATACVRTQRALLDGPPPSRQNPAEVASFITHRLQCRTVHLPVGSLLRGNSEPLDVNALRPYVAHCIADNHTLAHRTHDQQISRQAYTSAAEYQGLSRPGKVTLDLIRNNNTS
jgi:hypothetical protein